MEQLKRNRNALRSRNMLINALVELLQDTPIEKITVTSIVNKAGLNRSTFYAHFERPSDIVESIQQDVISNLDSFLEDVGVSVLLKDPMVLMNKIADFFTERRDFYRMLIRAHHSDTFLDKFKETLIEKLIQENIDHIDDAKRERFAINLRFLVGGYISIYGDWLTDKIEMDPHKFSEITAMSLLKGVEYMQKKTI